MPTSTYKVDETQSNILVDLTNGDSIVYLKQFTTPGKSYTIEDVLGKASPTRSIYILATEGTVFSDGTYSIVLRVPYASIRLNTLSPNIWQVTSMEVKPTLQPGAFLQEPITRTITNADNKIIYNTNITYVTPGTTNNTYITPDTISDTLSTLTVSSIASFSSFTANRATVLGQFTASTFSTLGPAAVTGTLTATSFSTFANASIHGDLYVKGVLYTPGGGGGGAVTNNTYITNPVVSTCSTLTVSSMAYFSSFVTSSFSASMGSVLGEFKTTSFSTLAGASVYGTLTTTSFSTLAGASVYGTLTTTSFSTLGSAAIDGDLYVKGLLYTPQGSIVSTFSTLTVYSIADFSSITTTGNASISRLLTADSVSVTNGLTVNGAFTASGGTTITGGASITGNLFINGDPYVAGGGGSGTTVTYFTYPVENSLSTLIVSSIAVFSTFTVNKDATINNLLTTTYFSTLTNAAIAGTLKVNQYTTLSSFSTLGDAAIGGLLTVKNGISTGSVFVNGIISTTSAIYIGGNIAASGTLRCGAITTSGALALGTNTITCGAITTSGALALGTNTISCGAITTSGTLSLGTNTITCGSITCGSITGSGQQILNGSVSVGKSSAPTVALDVSGAITASGEITAYSDARLKTNVVSIENALSTINELRGVYYNKKDDPTKSLTGVIAQEVECVFPEVVHTDTSADAYKSVAYGNFAGLFIEAIKSLKREVDTVKAELSTLKGSTL